MRPGRFVLALWDDDARRRLSDWIDRVSSILEGGVTLGDNIRNHTIVFTWNTDNAPMTLACPFRSAPRSVWVLRATHPDGTQRSPVAVLWKFVPGSVSVSDIPGLTASTNYVVDLMMLEA